MKYEAKERIKVFDKYGCLFTFLHCKNEIAKWVARGFTVKIEVC